MHGWYNSIRLEHVTYNHIDGTSPGIPLQWGGIAHQATDAVSQLQQAGDKPSSDIPGCACHQYETTFFILCCHFFVFESEIRLSQFSSHSFRPLLGELRKCLAQGCLTLAAVRAASAEELFSLAVYQENINVLLIRQPQSSPEIYLIEV